LARALFVRCGEVAVNAFRSYLVMVKVTVVVWVMPPPFAVMVIV
jgi:hypothetical protein